MGKVEAKLAGCDLVEGRQSKFHKKQRCGHSQSGMQEGFAEELPDELSSRSAQRFPKSDFLGASFKTGCGQVHEVDAGDKQDEDGDQGKNTDESHRPVRTIGIVQVNPGKFLKLEDFGPARSAGFQESGNFLFQ